MGLIHHIYRIQSDLDERVVELKAQKVPREALPIHRLIMQLKDFRWKTLKPCGWSLT